MTDLITRVEGFGAAMIDVTYRKPDAIWLFQQYVQNFDDHHPDFPRAKRLLRHMKKELGDLLVCAAVDHVFLPRPIPILSIDGEPLTTVVPVVTKLQYN